MFKNVLVGVDGRPNGRDAIALACRLTRPGGKLTLAHVHGGLSGRSHPVKPQLAAAEREASRSLLEMERSVAEVDAELLSIASTSPGRGLHTQADEEEADLLVVGSCSRGVLGRAMLGDDTRAALNGAPCAVAVASVGYAEHPAPMARVGVAYNGSPESDAALVLAREVASATHATIHALEVVPEPIHTFMATAFSVEDAVEVTVGEVHDRLSEIPGVDARAVYGLAREELAAFSCQVDILVIGSRGYGPIRRLVLGSTSDFMASHAGCSVLVTPRGAGRSN